MALSIRTLLQQYGIAPQKGLGQNFLVAEGVLTKIVAAAEIAPGDAVLEVGPGLGTLTQALADAGARVVAVELDRGLIPLLEDRVGHLAQVEILHGDILQLDVGQLMAARQGVPYLVVANLPYTITSAALRHLLESDSPPRRLVVMVQKEVAQRIVAGPGEMSLLALSVQFYGQPGIVAHVPAGSFVPRPKVDSAILRLDLLVEPRLPPQETRRFFALARAGFAQRRKQLKNTLASTLRLESRRVEEILQGCGIDPRRRAQSLSVEEWLVVERAFAAQGLPG